MVASLVALDRRADEYMLKKAVQIPGFPLDRGAILESRGRFDIVLVWACDNGAELLASGYLRSTSRRSIQVQARVHPER